MKTLKSKVILTMAVVLTVSMLLSTFAAIMISRKVLSESVNDSLKNLVAATAYKIQDINNQEYKMLESFSYLSKTKDSEVDIKDKWNDLNAIGKKDSRYIGMAYYDENGIGWTTTGKYQDLHERDYIQQSMKGVKGLMNPSYSKINGKISTFYSVPVYDFAGRLNGIAVAVVDSMELCESLKNMDIGNGLYPYIISMSTGKYVASVDLNNLKEEKNIEANSNPVFNNILKNIKAGETSVDIYKNDSTKEKRIVAYTPVGGDCDWTVVYDVPYRDFFYKLNEMLSASLCYLLAALVIGCLILFLIIGKFLKPLKKFNQKMIDNTKDDTELDLTTGIEVKGNDEICKVINNYNRFNEKLRNVVIDITESKEKLSETGAFLRKSVIETSNGISDILENINNVACQISTQSESVNDTSSAVSTISNNIYALGQLIEEQTNGFSQASSAIEEMIANIESVDNSVEKMAVEFEKILKQINSSTKKQDEVNSLVVQVAEQSEMLNEANSVIASIAEQTNLLAMNAAIEAAHAGEAGKGFSVVADEIRKLSENSGDQSKTIGEQLNKISMSIANVVEGSNETRDALTTVNNAIMQTNDLVIQIKAAMSEQSTGSKQITDVLLQMNENNKQVKVASTEMEAGNDKILKQIAHLQNATDGIKNSVSNMTMSAKNIEQTETALDNTSDEVHEVITKIGAQIDKFHV